MADEKDTAAEAPKKSNKMLMIVIALALWTGMIPVLVLGGLGTIMAVQTLVQTTLRGAGAGAALVLGGLLTVGTIVMRLRGHQAGRG